MLYLQQQQLKDLQKLAKAPRDRLLIDVLYQTGCTVSEIIEIKRQNLRDCEIRIKDRACVVRQELIQRLHAYCQTHNSQYVFATRQSLQLTPRRVQQLVRMYLSKLYLPSIKHQTPQLLRYTHIAHAAKKGISLEQIQKQTGLEKTRLAEIVAQVLAGEKGYGGGL